MPSTTSNLSRRRAVSAAMALFGLGVGGLLTPITATAAGGALPESGSSTHTIMVNGVQRSYIMSIPAGYTGRHPKAVIFAFHGHNQTNTQMEKYTDFDARNAIIVYHQGRNGRDGESAWESAPYASTNDGDQDTAMTLRILARLKREYAVDPNRVFAVGKSNGGGFATKLGCTHPDVFAAVASVAGAYYPHTHSGCSTQPLPYLEIHGQADTVIPYDGDTKNDNELLGARAMAETYAQRDHCSSPPRATPAAPGVTRFEWECAGTTLVEHVRVRDGGHTWPGAPAGSHSGPGHVNTGVSATSLIWDFFSSHPKTLTRTR